MDIRNIPRLDKRLRLILYCVLLILALWLFLSYTVLNVQFNQGTRPDGTLTIKKNTPGQNKAKKIRFGINIVKRGDSLIAFSANNQETVAYKNVRLFSTNKVSIKLKPQKSVDKLITNAPDNQSICEIKGSPGDSRNYLCSGQQLYQQEGLKPVAPTTGLYIVGTPQPYQDGLLAFGRTSLEEETPIQLFYTTGQTKSLITSDVSKYLDVDEGKFATYASSTAFLIINKADQKLFYFNSIRSQPIEYNYAPDISGAPSDLIEASLTKSGLYISYTSPESHQTNPVKNTEGTGQPRVIRYSINKDIISKKAEYELASPSASAYVASDKTAFTIDISGQLSVFSIASQKPKKIFTSYNTTDAIGISGTLYYVNGRGIYMYSSEDNTSYLVRSLKANNISSLGSAGENLTFSGNSNNSLSTNSVYVVSDKNRDNVEAYDVIPYNLNELPLVRSDFKSGTLYFWVNLSSIRYERGVEQPTYNKGEFDTKKQTILKRLRSDGLDLSHYKIVFYPGG